MKLYYESASVCADDVVESEFGFDVDVSVSDAIAFARRYVPKPRYGETPLCEAYCAGRDAAIREMFGAFEEFWDALEKDDRFYEFMKERYAEEAYRRQEGTYDR